jgi:hypothetical protein
MQGHFASRDDVKKRLCKQFRAMSCFQRSASIRRTKALQGKEKFWPFPVRTGQGVVPTPLAFPSRMRDIPRTAISDAGRRPAARNNAHPAIKSHHRVRERCPDQERQPGGR